MPSSMLMDAPQNNQICAAAGEYDQSGFAHLSPEEQHMQFNICMGCDKEAATPHCQHHNKHDPKCFICVQARTRDAMALTGSAKKERSMEAANLDSVVHSEPDANGSSIDVIMVLPRTRWWILVL